MNNLDYIKESVEAMTYKLECEEWDKEATKILRSECPSFSICDLDDEDIMSTFRLNGMEEEINTGMEAFYDMLEEYDYDTLTIPVNVILKLVGGELI